MDVAATPGSPFLITTPIFYVNAEPHLGHLFTAVLADAGARWARLKGHDVIFATGTDEHGLKVQHAADAKGVSAQAFCDTTSARFRSLFDQAGISYDRFVRTTDADHVEMVSSVWQELQRKGLIRMGHHEGWYCEGDEAFLTSQQVRKATAEDAAVLGVTLPDDGDADAEPVMVSTESGRVVERVAEENYVFCLSQFEDVLQQWIRRHETTTALDDGTATAAAVIPTVVPSVRRREVCNMLKERLRDLSVSRLSCNVEWGIPVPGDATHTVYVWLDALVNYLTVTGRTLPELLAAGDDDHVHWPGTHVVGKDILKFHAIYWPAFLAGLGLPLPERVVAHGHWIVDNVKMSKSLGNVVDPYALLERHGRDESRYFLLQEGALQVCFGRGATVALVVFHRVGLPRTFHSWCYFACWWRQYDAQFSHERVEERRRTELVSKLGNLVSRATAPVLLPNRVMPCALPEQWLTADDVAFLECVQSTADSVATLYDELNFHQALGLVVELMYVRCNGVPRCVHACACVNKLLGVGDQERCQPLL